MNRLKTTMVPAQVTGHGSSGSESELRGLAGFYVLTTQGSLARLDIEGVPVMEPCLTAGLSPGIDEILDQYRGGETEIEIFLGVILDIEAGAAGTMIFTDDVLNHLFDTGRRSGMPLTIYERRNKSKSVSQGMELLLNKKRPADPFFPYYCPVLIAPDCGADSLCRRYGIDADTAARVVYEIVDLSVPFLSSHCPPQELFEIRSDMRRAQTGPARGDLNGAIRRGGGDHGRDEAARSGALVKAGTPTGMSPVRSVSDTVFKEGDAVTGWLLEWFSPFNELTETQREIIAGYETIRKVAAGTRLLERGSTLDSCFYLVEGTLELVTEEGENIRVSGGSRRSRLPISILAPHVYDVTAVTDGSVVVFSQKLVRKINEITRTYTGINRARSPEDSTAEISNGVQSTYFKYANV